MKESGIYRNRLPVDENFTIVPNDWLRNTGLTPVANFLLVYLLSHEVGYEIRVRQIVAETKIGVKAFRSAIKELQAENWVSVSRAKNADGTLGSYRYELNSSRVPQGTVARSTVAQSTVAQGTLLRKQLRENNYREDNKRAIKLPNDWKPSDRLMGMFDSKWPDVDRDYEIEQFQTYWWASGKTKVDWDMTFQNWMGRVQKRSGGSGFSAARLRAEALAEMERENNE
jgi:hypothetical protein